MFFIKFNACALGNIRHPYIMFLYSFAAGRNTHVRAFSLPIMIVRLSFFFVIEFFFIFAGVRAYKSECGDVTSLGERPTGAEKLQANFLLTLKQPGEADGGHIRQTNH